MRTFIRGVLIVVVVAALALPGLAATPSEFYLGMLQKGVNAYDAGRFDAATGPLRIAAFGFVDSIPQYQTAQVYLALAHDRLGNEEAAREAARRVVIAQRLDARYASLQLSPATRTAFDNVARKTLSPADYAALGSAAAPPATTPVTTPATTSPVTTVASITPATRPESEPNTPPPAPVKSEPTPVVVAPPQTETKTPVVEKPAPQPETKQPEITKPAPRPDPPKPASGRKPATTPVVVTPAPIDMPARFTAANQALNAANLVEARAIYRELLDRATLERDDLLRLAEGFYRARDFANALRAFEKLGALRRGEEPYRYYIAVALYETGQYAQAKNELAAVLPYIEETPDVTRYRVKIEGAVN